MDVARSPSVRRDDPHPVGDRHAHRRGRSRPDPAVGVVTHPEKVTRLAALLCEYDSRNGAMFCSDVTPTGATCPRQSAHLRDAEEWYAAGVRAQPEPSEQLAPPGACRGGRTAGQQHRKLDVVRDAQVRDEVEELEHVADVAASQPTR